MDWEGEEIASTPPLSSPHLDDEFDEFDDYSLDEGHELDYSEREEEEEEEEDSVGIDPHSDISEDEFYGGLDEIPVIPYYFDEDAAAHGDLDGVPAISPDGLSDLEENHDHSVIDLDSTPEPDEDEVEDEGLSWYPAPPSPSNHPDLDGGDDNHEHSVIDLDEPTDLDEDEEHDWDPESLDGSADPYSDFDDDNSAEHFEDGLPDDFDDAFPFDPFGLGEGTSFASLERLITRFQSEVDDLTESVVRELRQRVGGGGESSRPPGTGLSPSSRSDRAQTSIRNSPLHPTASGRHVHSFHPYYRSHPINAANSQPVEGDRTSRASSGLPFFPSLRPLADPIGPDRVARRIVRSSGSPNMSDHLHEVVLERRGGLPGPRQAPGPAYIDLTNSDDEPEARSMPPPPPNAAPHRNPRRQSQIRRTPSLARSDGSLLGGAPVIDLTGDDMPSSQPPQPRHGRGSGSNRQGGSSSRRQPREDGLDHIDLVVGDDEDEELNPGGAFFDIFRNFGGGADGRFFIGGGIGLLHRLGGHVFGHQPAEVDVQFLGQSHRMDNPAANPLANNAPNFNYGANGYNNPAANEKPPYVPPPPAEPGFTRNTGEDQIVICPSCEEELAYDPDEEQTRPVKKARSKKDQEEHHFWAVKECGHVSEFVTSVTFLILCRLTQTCRYSAATAMRIAPRQTRPPSGPSRTLPPAVASRNSFSARWRTARPT
ncbi:hypothetical protein GQ53DRAFT_361376 [Thozetella sp. PMI_491]|nr:hypothetical protein GQ53DRAFT_361376 [Thozetella sp. PMI_491]